MMPLLLSVTITYNAFTTLSLLHIMPLMLLQNEELAHELYNM